jgi:hypothetical protein
VSSTVNLTNSDAAYVVCVGIDGKWQVTVVVKTTYVWDQRGQVTPTEPAPITVMDEFAGEPASSGLLRASDLGPVKPRLDVLLAGALAFPRPTAMIDVHLAVGSRLRKRARVFGDRAWLPSTVAELVPSQPRPVSSVAIAWENSYGGGNIQDPKCVEPRNPAGSGVAKDPKSLQGKPAPYFEDPDKPLGAMTGSPAPVGFGPIAGHWQARLALAGTYDENWEKTRRPLPPLDFSPVFFNVAPADQQLDGYLPGEVVAMLNMTTAGQDQFRLPDLAVPVTIVTSDELSEDITVVDTLIIEPGERRFSLLGRVQATLASGPEALGRIIVGEMPKGMRKAVELGKKYRWPKERSHDNG